MSGRARYPKKRSRPRVTHVQANNVTGFTRIITWCGRRLDDQRAWAISDLGATCKRCRAALSTGKPRKPPRRGR